MSMFRRTADKHIDRAHCAIASAEMEVERSRTDEHKAIALHHLAAAQRYLQRAIAARNARDAAEHDDYEDYPHVTTPAEEQISLCL